jgi:uncharacterized delta-60 repeat protein
MQIRSNAVTALLTAAALGFFVHVSRASSLVDTSFNPGSGVDGFVENVLQQPDGKILICGNFTQYDGAGRSYIARLNSDGSLDSSFVAGPSYWVRTMALQSDGKIVIGGWFHQVEGQPRNAIARLNTDGSLDTSFNPGSGAWGTLGIGIDGKTNEFIFATAVQPDGKILITGNFTNYNGVRINGLARLNSNGSLDTTFDTGDGLNTWGRSLTLLSDGRFIVTGWFNHYHNADHSRMAIVSPDGSADPNFNPNFGDQTAVYSAIPLANGQFIVSGHSENVHQIFQQDIARLNGDGSFDTSFVGSANDKTEMVRMQSDGKVLMCGYFGAVDGAQRTDIARINQDGTLDNSFNVSVDNFIWSMFVQADGRILIAGGFRAIDGYSRSGIARLFQSVQSEDLLPPNIQIKQPPNTTSTIDTSTLNIAGIAHDSNGVASVTMTVNGQSVHVGGTTNWGAAVTLLPGNNVITVNATDTFGNEASVTRYLVHPGSTPMTVTTDGQGTVQPNLNGAMLTAGSAYSMTAVPASGYLFAGWSGTVNTSGATVSFTMDRGTTLHATFIPSPFLSSAGVFRGLAFNADTPKAATAASVLIRLANNGTYSGQVSFAGAVSPIVGRFNSNFTSSVSVQRAGRAPLKLDLQLVDTKTIQGTLSGGSFSASLTAYRNGFSPANPATAGVYNVLLPPNPGAGTPAGYGYMTLRVQTNGGVVVSAVMGDGAPSVQFTTLSANQQVAFFFPYGVGVAYGWLGVTPNASSDSDVQGTIHWEKRSGTNLLFRVDVSVIGSIYHKPGPGTNVLSLTDGTFELDHGGLTQTISDSITVTSANQFVFGTPNPNAISQRLVASSGHFIGAFLSPTTHTPVGYSGVVLQKQNIGGGFFVNNGRIGRVFFGSNGVTPP